MCCIYCILMSVIHHSWVDHFKVNQLITCQQSHLYLLNSIPYRHTPSNKIKMGGCYPPARHTNHCLRGDSTQLRMKVKRLFQGHHIQLSSTINSYSASHDNWCTVGGDGGCRVGEVRAGTTSLMPDHKGFKLQYLVNFQKFSTLRVNLP